jgi:hypothetical protein
MLLDDCAVADTPVGAEGAVVVPPPPLDLAKVTVCGSLEMPDLFIETEIVPAVEVVTASDHEVPPPVNAPLVASPLPSVMVMLEAVKPDTDELKLKLRAVVVEPPVGETE